MKVTSTKLDNSTYEKLIEKCTRQGCNTAEYLRNLILNDVEGNNAVKEELLGKKDDIFADFETFKAHVVSLKNKK